MIKFSKMTYRQQINGLRKLALKALEQYDFNATSIKLMNHGENTTFLVKSSQGNRFLLRVCRYNYHSQNALKEELRWLSRLEKTQKFQIPKPVRNLKKQFLGNIKTQEIPEGRNFALFEWIDGRFIGKSITEKQMLKIGELLARLHNQSLNHKVMHRRYWDAEGLVGSRSLFGSIDSLAGVTKVQQKMITRARKTLLKKLKQYEKNHPSSQGLIHADLHFGNLLFNSKGIVAIDFDDCGLGFVSYDLAIPLLSVERTKGIGAKQKLLLRKALLAGYRRHRELSALDEKMIDELRLARHLSMLGWFNTRKDNSMLQKYFKKSVTATVRFIRSMGY